MKFPRCVLERISMKYDRNLGAFGTKERNEIWAEVGRNSGLRQLVVVRGLSAPTTAIGKDIASCVVGVSSGTMCVLCSRRGGRHA